MYEDPSVYIHAGKDLGEQNHSCWLTHAFLLVVCLVAAIILRSVHITDVYIMYIFNEGGGGGT